MTELRQYQAPAGIGVDLLAFRAPDGEPWWPTRPKIRPRLIIIHTNAASRESNVGAAIRWGNSVPYGRTHPHYWIGGAGSTKLVPTDRRAIGNATHDGLQADYGVPDVSYWSIVIETRDAGYLASGGNADLGPFLDDDLELVARAVAWEAALWDIPLEVPSAWTGSGVVCHTWPFAYDEQGRGFYTVTRGKTCPGQTKIGQLPDVLHRARQIRDAWRLQMIPLKEPVRLWDSRAGDGSPLSGSKVFELPSRLGSRVGGVLVNVTTVNRDGSAGYISGRSVDQPEPISSITNFEPGLRAAGNTALIPVKDGRFVLTTSAPVHVIVDIMGITEAVPI